MSTLGTQIQTARRYAKLTSPKLAALAGVEASRLSEIEAGRERATTDEVDRIAQVFGVSRRGLVGGEAAQSPWRVLLRSTQDADGNAIDKLIETRAIRDLGTFQRCVRDAAELETLLDHKRPMWPVVFRGEDVEREAKMFRLAWGLGDGPIDSMRALLAERLDVRVFFTTPGTMSAEVDGASTDWPRPAILANLVNGGGCWWRTRMTLAHELAHLLFDMQQHRTLFSPSTPERTDREARRVRAKWQLFAEFGDIEAHASAFAACLLAPREAVRASVEGFEPTSDQAIARVASRFGVGRIVAINRLQRAFGLSPEERLTMIDRTRELQWEASFDRDVVREGIGLQRGPLSDLVAEALIGGKIGKVRAREILGVPLTEGLPFPELPEALTAPVVSHASHLRSIAQRLAGARHPECEVVVDDLSRDGDRWRMVVFRGGAGAREYTRIEEVWLADDGRELEVRALATARLST